MKSLPEDLALLQACGEALWGEDWRPALRAQFRVDARTTRRWLNGQLLVPREFWIKLAEHMHARTVQISILAATIDSNLNQE